MHDGIEERNFRDQKVIGDASKVDWSNWGKEPSFVKGNGLKGSDKKEEEKTLWENRLAAMTPEQRKEYTQILKEESGSENEEVEREREQERKERSTKRSKSCGTRSSRFQHPVLLHLRSGSIRRLFE